MNKTTYKILGFLVLIASGILFLVVRESATFKDAEPLNSSPRDGKLYYVSGKLFSENPLPSSHGKLLYKKFEVNVIYEEWNNDDEEEYTAYTETIRKEENYADSLLLRLPANGTINLTEMFAKQGIMNSLAELSEKIPLNEVIQKQPDGSYKITYEGKTTTYTPNSNFSEINAKLYYVPNQFPLTVFMERVTPSWVFKDLRKGDAKEVFANLGSTNKWTNIFFLITLFLGIGLILISFFKKKHVKEQ